MISLSDYLKRELNYTSELEIIDFLKSLADTSDTPYVLEPTLELPRYAR